MKNALLLVGAAALGLAVYLVLSASEAPTYAEGDAVDELGDRIGGWGARQRVSGVGDTFSGHLKNAAGVLTGDDELRGEGSLNRVAGSVEDAAGKAAHAVEDAIHDLNR